MMKHRYSLTLLLMVLSLLARVGGANAATYYVATTGNDANTGTQSQPFLTIQRGINAAVSGDTVLVANGTYVGTGNRNLNFGGKNFTLRSLGGAANCIIDLQQTRQRAFVFQNNETTDAVVEGFTIQNGKMRLQDAGGGIYCFRASPAIRRCAFRNNEGLETSRGGAIFLSSSAASVTDCMFTSNVVAQNGGAIFISGSESVPVITRCTFTLNGAGESGGAIYTLLARPQIRECVFLNNGAGIGGGVYAEIDSNATLQNCLLNNNSGGGVAVRSSSTATLLHCTIVRHSEYGLLSVDYSGTLTVRNSVFWNNRTDTNEGDVTHSRIVSGGYTGSNNITADPLFVNGAGGDFHLQAASPCINTASPTAPNLPVVDFDGTPRTLGSAPDMGAFEWVPAGNLFVDTAAGNDTSGNGTPLLPYKTVTKAITIAPADSRIYIKQGNYGSDRPRVTKRVQFRNWGNTGQARIGKP